LKTEPFFEAHFSRSALITTFIPVNLLHSTMPGSKRPSKLHAEDGTRKVLRRSQTIEISDDSSTEDGSTLEERLEVIEMRMYKNPHKFSEAKLIVQRIKLNEEQCGLNPAVGTAFPVRVTAIEELLGISP
jgi:hypothetical protein